MRRIGLGETLRIALTGNDERVSAQTALRIGLVTEVVEADELWTRAHEIAAMIAAHPTSATQGTVKAIWESLDKPYRAALDQGLIYTRLGNPLGQAELDPAAGRPSRGSADAAHPLSQRIADVLALAPDAPAIEYEDRWSTWGEVGEYAAPDRDTRRAPRRQPSPGRRSAAQHARSRRHLPRRADRRTRRWS